MARYVYFFADGKAEGSSRLRSLLGGKGCEIAEMTNLGIPVPPGFTITTEAWAEYDRTGHRAPEALWPEVLDGIARLEGVTGAKLGGASRPLLVSVRSGARVSMPGMMETVLNLGLNDVTVEALAAWTGNERFALDCYRRFITMFGDVVLGIERRDFDERLDAVKRHLGARTDPEVPPAELRKLIQGYKAVVAERAGRPFPQDPPEQLRLAITAVFDSWYAKRAVEYRRIHGIPADWGTAVTVMSMVFGNLGETSGTGVAFTRDPGTGERRFYGEFLVNAQGEDVVAGIRTPEPITALRESMPGVYDELVAIKERLEVHYRDMQDLEFTVQEGKLFLLQTRSGKRTAAAAVRVAVEMLHEGLIDQDTALLRVEPARLNDLLHDVFDESDKAAAIADGRLLAKGLPAAPRAAVGQVVFDADRAVEWAKGGKRVILVRAETSPEDVAGMWAADGILTSRGGLTSHAAVVARGMGKCGVVGAGDIAVDEERHVFEVGGFVVREGDKISVDGHTGEVVRDEVKLIEPSISGELEEFLGWADAARILGVRANADTPEDARKARELGAEGIGLVRTEHMFFDKERIPIVRAMIMAADKKSRAEALAQLLPFQRDDFVGIFRAMDGLPVTIRLLDPPLHEFLPRYTELLEEYVRLDARGINPDRADELKREMATVGALQEANPMLGHRGCRLGVTFPEIYEMQVRAIMEAACEVARASGHVEPEIMIPLTGTVGEMTLTHAMARRVADAVIAETGVTVGYSIGTMIEVPRAALIADQIARYAEFFSFGTNDLTQMTFGYSRDDVGKFLPYYLDKGLVPHDPFSVLDQEGVGELIRIGIERGRRTRPELKIGICGEHGGEPESVEFCHRVRMSYVSCSPFMIPIARLAAAQALIKERKASRGDKR
ncbi:MAG: pyruvate, phosphate dikinase [Candidatus Rokubacteria bacterium]|nr:pyruvate, phosphate dikinase [Candidatus Rokubacteria bacterium]